MSMATLSSNNAHCDHMIRIGIQKRRPLDAFHIKLFNPIFASYSTARFDHYPSSLLAFFHPTVEHVYNQLALYLF